MNTLKKYKYRLNNLDCANCANKIEERLKKENNLSDVVVNFSLLTLSFMSNDDIKIEDISNIVTKIEPEVVVTKIDEEVKETKNLINYLTTLKMESEIDFYNIGNYWITVEPKCYLLPYAKISQSEICFTKDNPRYYAKLFEYLPFINQAQVTNVENICDSPQSVTEWFFVIPEIIYNQIPQEFLEDAKVVPRRHCLNTVVINEDWEYPNTEIFRDIFNYLKKHNIKSCGIATATYPNYYFQESGKKVRYAKVKVPIELKGV